MKPFFANINNKFYGIWLAILALYALSAVLSPDSININQMMSVLQVSSFLGIMSLGQTMVLITGGLDLSVAGVVTLTNIVSTGIMHGQPENILSGIAICFGLAIFVGLINGIAITIARITPLVATLAMNAILTGGALIYSGGAPRGSIPEIFQKVGTERVFNFLPISVVIWIAMTLIFFILTEKTKYGRFLYATGSNRNASNMVGIHTNAIVISAYVFSSLTSAVGALILTAFIGLPSFGIGEPYMLKSIAAVVVGGTTLTGGVGSVVATAGGAWFITQLTSITNVLKVSQGIQYLVQGFIIAVGVGLHTIRKN